MLTRKINPVLFRLHVFGFIFTSRLFTTIIFLLILPILIWLGFWQLSRADYKANLQTQFDTRKHNVPLHLAQLNKTPEKLAYQPVKIHGQYDNQHTFLLDNRINGRKIGYEVITPLILANSNKRLLVNRGFIPRGINRNQLPTIKAITTAQTIQGVIKLPPKRTLVLAESKAPTRWPSRIQAINIKKMQATLKQPLYPFVVLLSPNMNNGFIRNWKPVAMMPAKHHGYAFQWFSLALTLVIIYCIVNTSRGRHDKIRKKED